MQKGQAGNTALFCMQANPLTALSPLGAFRGFVSMQRCDACNFSPFCIYHYRKQCCSSLYGYHREGNPANASMRAQARTAPRPSVIHRPSGYRAQPTGSHQPTDTICLGVSSTFSSLAFSVPSLLLPTGSVMRLHALDCLRAPQRSRSRWLRAIVRSRIPWLPFSYVLVLEHSQPSSFS